MGNLYPPALLGHDEQDLLKNSGLPAAAWVHAVRVVPAPTKQDPQGAKLQVKFGDAPASVCRLINRRAYRKTSAEIYDEPPGDCKNVPGVKGKVLRAVALLGGEQPRIKRLEDIPQFNEATGQSTDWVDVFATGEYDGDKYTASHLQEMANNYKLLTAAGVNPAKFSDRTSSGRGAFRRVFMEAPRSGTMYDELRKKLIAAGMPEAVVNAMDDSALAEFANACSQIASQAAGAAPEGGAATTGEQPAVQASEGGPAMQTDDGKGAMGEPAPGAAKPDDDTMKKYSDTIVKKVLETLSIQGNAAQAAADRIKVIDAMTARRLFSEKVAKAVSEGRIAPAVNQGNLIETIAETIATGGKVAKFSEKETSLEKLFETLVDRLAVQKPVSLRERLPGQANFSESEKTNEVAKVKDHYQRYSDRFRKTGTDEATYVKAFEVLSERGVTAEEYTGAN